MAQFIDLFQKADHFCSPLAAELRHISILYDPSGDRDGRSRLDQLGQVYDLLWGFVGVRQQAALLSSPQHRHVHAVPGMTPSLSHRNHEPRFRSHSLREVCVSQEILDGIDDDADQLAASLSDRFGLSVRLLSANDEGAFSR